MIADFQIGVSSVCKNGANIDSFDSGRPTRIFLRFGPPTPILVLFGSPDSNPSSIRDAPLESSFDSVTRPLARFPLPLSAPQRSALFTPRLPQRPWHLRL